MRVALRAIGGARGSVLVRVTDASGQHGVGEASPLPGYSPDDLDDAHAALAAWTPPALDAHDDPLPAITRAIAGLTAPSARFAAETALLDFAARHRGVPLHRLLGDGARAVPLSLLLPSNDDAVDAARRWWQAGGRDVKVKLQAPHDAALARVAAVRAALPDVAIRADANGGLAASEVADTCRALARLGVVLLEEPCATAAVGGLSRLAVPIGLDESLQLPGAEDRIAATAATHDVGAVVLKPTALGGLLRCRAIARAAAARGIGAIVTHTFDGPVAMAAAAELALALPTTVVAGLAPHPALAGFPAIRGAALGDVALAPHDAPGLGLDAVEAW